MPLVEPAHPPKLALVSAIGNACCPRIQDHGPNPPQRCHLPASRLNNRSDDRSGSDATSRITLSDLDANVFHPPDHGLQKRSGL